LAIVPGAAVAPPVKVATLPAPPPTEAGPPADIQPNGQVTEVSVPAATHLYVQVGAFSQLDNARRLLRTIGGDLHISTLQRGGQTLYRVRTGPLNSVEEADTALARITSAGSSDARIVVDQ
jgi:rare lipoprotein A